MALEGSFKGTNVLFLVMHCAKLSCHLKKFQKPEKHRKLIAIKFLLEILVKKPQIIAERIESLLEVIYSWQPYSEPRVSAVNYYTIP